MTSASELRRRARETLGGNIFKSPWLYALVVGIIVAAIASVASFIPIGSLLVAGPIAIGTGAYFLNRVRRRVEHDNLEILFDGVKDGLGDNIILGVLYSIFIALWTLLFVIPGIVKSYSYSMAYYIKLDHPEYTPTQAITESRKLMDGNKMRLFCLHLSFIGWAIVCCFTFGIGTFWLIPYMNAANAEFYQDLVMGRDGVEAPFVEVN